MPFNGTGEARLKVIDQANDSGKSKEMDLPPFTIFVVTSEVRCARIDVCDAGICHSWQMDWTAVRAQSVCRTQCGCVGAAPWRLVWP